MLSASTVALMQLLIFRCVHRSSHWTPYNKWFLGPTRVYHLIGISIGSAVFAGLTNVTDRQTDIQTAIGRL